MSEHAFSMLCFAAAVGAGFAIVFRSVTLASICGSILLGWALLALCSRIMLHLHLAIQPETFASYLFILSPLLGWLQMSLAVLFATLARLPFIIMRRRSRHHHNVA